MMALVTRVTSSTTLGGWSLSRSLIAASRIPSFKREEEGRAAETQAVTQLDYRPHGWAVQPSLHAAHRVDRETGATREILLSQTTGPAQGSHVLAKGLVVWVLVAHGVVGRDKSAYRKIASNAPCTCSTWGSSFA